MSIRKLLLLLLLLAPLGLAKAEGLALLDLTRGEQAVSFVPTATAEYDVCAFPAEGEAGEVSAKVTLDDETIAEGTGRVTVLTTPLVAGEAYTVALTGGGRVYLEVARHALSRCFDDPKPLDPAGDEYAKSVVKPGDAHWYALTADVSQPLLLTGLPEAEGLHLEARLFSETGRLLAEATRTAGGAVLMDFMPRPGRTYRVRVSASEGGTGLYTLKVAPGTGGLPEALILSEDRVALDGRERRALQWTAIPEGAAGPMLWESSDERVARVSQDGVVTGARPGTAVVTAYAAGAVRARCRVEVARVPAAGLELITANIHMAVGDDVALEWRVLPEAASDPRVTFAVEPSAVASVDANGVLRALSVGQAVLTLRTADGGFEAVGALHVAPAQKRYRALLVGEQGYAPEVASLRLGSANSVAGMRSMLNALSYLGTRFETTTALDVSKDEVLRAIEAAFDGATEQDAALFYITCHGKYAHGMAVFQMYDGSELTALELRRALDQVPGEIILMLDCCGSGGALGGFAEGFNGLTGPNLFGSSRFRVLASALVDQDSYRISFDGAAQETTMATLFARAVCEGCGWSIDRAQRRAMRADINYDDVVTLDELYHYARRRVMWYLSLTPSSETQTVIAWPEGDAKSLFERTKALE